MVKTCLWLNQFGTLGRPYISFWTVTRRSWRSPKPSRNWEFLWSNMTDVPGVTYISLWVRFNVQGQVFVFIYFQLLGIITTSYGMLKCVWHDACDIWSNGRCAVQVWCVLQGRSLDAARSRCANFSQDIKTSYFHLETLKLDWYIKKTCSFATRGMHI